MSIENPKSKTLNENFIDEMEILIAKIRAGIASVHSYELKDYAEQNKSICGRFAIIEKVKTCQN
jgi:hypothetical protein